MAKKYFWLKLKEDFFRDKKIKKLRKIAGGDTFTIIYLKMQLLSLKNNGFLYYEGIENSFYEELALDIDEGEDNVKVTLAFMLQNGLIEEVEADKFAMIQTMESIGSETDVAVRVRKHREKTELPPVESKKALPAKSNAERQKAHRAKVNCEQKQHIPYIENHVNQKRYGGNYYVTIQRDRYACSICESIENLCVHHIDGYDENKPENNNSNKMITLCRSCHSRVHAGLEIPKNELDRIGYNDNVTLLGNVTVTTCNTEREKERELEIDLEGEKEEEREREEEGEREEKTPPLSVVDYNFKSLIDHYEKHVKLLKVEYKECNLLSKMLDDYNDPKLIKKAMDIAVEKGKPHIAYINAILDNWRIDGITNYKQQEAEVKRRSGTNRTSSKLVADESYDNLSI